MTLLTLLAPTSDQLRIPTVWQGLDARVCVEVAFRSNPLASVLLWEDITAYVMDVQITRGRSGELDRFQPSTATFTLGSTGRDFDPEYVSGPWYGYVLPNRPIRFRVQYDAGAGLTEYFVWQGFVDEWPQDYTGLEFAEVQIPCSDAFAWLSGIAFDSPFAGEVNLDVSGTNAPSHWYRLGEPIGTTTAVDVIGAINGTYQNSPTLGATGLIYGSSDTAATFAGTDDRVYITSAVISSPTFAVEFMHQGSVIGDNSYWFECSNKTDGSQPDSQILVNYYVDDATPTIRLYVYDNASGGLAHQTEWDATTLLNGDEHHVVIGLNAYSESKCYIDGALNASYSRGADQAVISSFTAAMPYAAIGNSRPASGPVSGLGATLDEFIVWNGLFPSASRIAAHASAALTGWTGDTTAVLAGKVLDAVGWPTVYQDIGTGTTIGSGEGLSGTPYDILMTLADTESGHCYVDGQGRIVFRGRGELANDTRSAVSQAVFGDV